MSVAEDETFDLVVIGSGAAGLTTAVTAAIEGLSVLVIEKADRFGGTTAISLGGVWIPCNDMMAQCDQTDSAEEARAYLQAELGNHYDPAMIDAFVESGPEMLRYMEANSHVRFYPVALPDYHPEQPGAKAARTLLTREFDGRALGSLIRQVRNPLPGFVLMGSFQTDPQHMPKFTSALKSREGFAFTAKRMAGFARDMVRHRKGTHMANGNALVGRLLRSALDRGVVLRRNCPARRLVKEGGAVTGVVVEDNGGERTIGVRRAVMLAAGGFGANEEMRARYIPLADAHLSAQPAENIGEGIKLGEGAGGRIAEPNEANGIWAPCSARYDAGGNVVSVYPHFGPQRAKPGMIMVDEAGRRFFNEAAGYQDLVNAMNAKQIRNCWLIAHKPALRKYGMGEILPAPLPYRGYVKEGYVVEARTIADLARRIGADPAVLEATVARFNQNAAKGEDPDFDRGGNAYNNAIGDFDVQPNPNLGPLDRAPFYALKLHPGDCSSILGLVTGPDGEVLDDDGRPVPGLYAAGLDQNSVMRGTYPGGGSSIGPAMTFGWRAARAIAAKVRTEPAGAPA